MGQESHALKPSIIPTTSPYHSPVALTYVSTRAWRGDSEDECRKLLESVLVANRP